MSKEKERIEKGLAAGKTYYMSGGKKLKSKKQDGSKSAPSAVSTAKPDAKPDERSDERSDEKSGKDKK